MNRVQYDHKPAFQIDSDIRCFSKKMDLISSVRSSIASRHNVQPIENHNVKYVHDNVEEPNEDQLTPINISP